MEIQQDGNGQPYIEWDQGKGCYKRAWVQERTGDKDWAGTRRYLNVVRCDESRNPSGNPTDFPIFNDLPSDQILIAFVLSVCGITGCELSLGERAPK